MTTLEERLTGQKKMLKRTTQRDELFSKGIEQASTLAELGKSIGVTREAARLYLHQTGLHETWKEKRNQQKQERDLERRTAQQKLETEQETKAQFLYLLKEHLHQKAEQEGWVTQKAVGSFYTKDRRTYKLEDIYAVFQKYEQAQKEGKKLSLEKLAEGTPFVFPRVGRILREVGVEPMHGARDRTITPQWKVSAINRAYKSIPMTAFDIAYFLDLPYHVVNQRFFAKGKRSNLPLFAKSFGDEKLTYRLASQIYEAADLGFNKTEVTELLETASKVVAYALTERKTVESKIINALQVLYPEEEIKKPYRN